MDKKKRVCAIFNMSPKYREAIYRFMGRDLGCDFLVGDRSVDGISLLDMSKIPGFRGYVRNHFRGTKLVWQGGVLRRVIFGRQYDCYVMTGNAGIRSNWLVAAWARLCGRRVVLWTHGIHGYEQGLTLRKNLWYFKLASALFLYGEQARVRLMELGVPASKLFVVYNSLDYDAQLEIRGKVGDRAFLRNYFGNDLPVISYIGRLTATKRLDLLLQAMVGLECNLVVLGDGPMRAELEELASRLGIVDRVWFYGECYDQSVTGAVLYHSTVSVSPSSIGLMAIHSLMMGTPVVTHDDMNTQAPECEAVVAGVTGDFFVVGDVASLRATICKYLSLSDQQRQTMRLACYNEVDSHWNPHAQIKVIKQALGMLFDQ